MAEKSLNDPLNGAEIKRIILDEIERRLNGDVSLTDDFAYAGFSAKFEIKVSFRHSIATDTLVWGNTSVEPKADSEPAGETAINFSYTSQSPNTTRSEYGLPIPVMVQTPTGPVRKRVQIERKKE